jgi:hypothetical protein
LVGGAIVDRKNAGSGTLRWIYCDGQTVFDD